MSITTYDEYKKAKSKIEKLNYKKNEYTELENRKEKCISKIKTQDLSVPKRAGKLFSPPFKKKAFCGMNTAALACGATIIFAGVGSFIYVGLILCAVIDLIYIILYGALFPLTLLYCVIAKPFKLKRLNKKLTKLEGCLKKYNIKKILADIDELTKNAHKFLHSSSLSSSSGVENTEYYKNKKDEYYRQYMGLPPKDDKVLSDLATDTTLDLHPGDY